MGSILRLRLSAMMFLEFFVWGSWFVTAGTFLSQNLGATGSQIGIAYVSQSAGALIAPFIVGLIADRFFSAERILAVLHLANAVLLFMAGRQTEVTGFSVVIILSMVMFMPTLALVNSISFRHMERPGAQFPAVRVLGTVGWIVAGLAIGWWGWESQQSLQHTFTMGAIAALVLAAYSLTLPHTPPLARAGRSGTTVREILGVDALALLRNKKFLVFVIASILICIPQAFYYNFTNLYLNEIGVHSAAAVQSLGQASEVLFLLLMPLMLKRIGFKKTILIGIAAWAARYIAFGFGDAGTMFWLVIIGLLLHGVCYDFLFVAGQLYTDHIAPREIRSSAQGMISLATYGIGLMIGTLVSGPIVDALTSDEGTHNWMAIWLIPAAFAVAVTAFFAICFRNSSSGSATEPGAPA